MLPSPARRSVILTLALPIIGSMISQNILNLVDTWIVGSLGDAALAAVGIGGFANFTSQAAILGLSSGVQALASRRKGEGAEDQMAVSLNGGLLLAALIGIPVSLVLFQYATEIFRMLNDDPEVIRLGATYYQTRVVGVVAVGANFSYRGYWNGVSLSRMYMRTIVIMHLTNAFLSYGLVFGSFGLAPMGVAGAGIGTTISMILGTCIYTFLGFRHASQAGFLAKFPSRADLSASIRLSLPSSVQQFFFALGLTTLYKIVGLVGTQELAAANVLINLTLVAILPGMGLGLAAASLVGQALGRKNPEDASRWGWDVVKLATLLMTGLAIPYLVFTDTILGIFILNPNTLALARWPLRIVAISMPLEGIGMVLMQALLGAGASQRVMQVSVITQWLFFLPLAYLVGPQWGYGLFGIWCLQVGYRALQSGLFATLWHRGNWKTIQV